MKQTKYTCDICKKNMNYDINDKLVFYVYKIDHLCETEEIDLCVDCYELIKKYVRENRK